MPLIDFVQGRICLNPDNDVTIPASYVGIHCNRFPFLVAGDTPPVDPAPAYGFGRFRTWDAGFPSPFGWRDVQKTSGGAFDFTAADAHLEWFFSRGIAVTWCLGGLTPTWAAQAAFQATNTPYGLGAFSPANVISNWQSWVTAVVTRYAGRGIHWETWNEPNGGYFLGTEAELLAHHRVVQATVKSLDPSGMVVGPAFTGALLGGAVQSWLKAVDAGSGLRGIDMLDALTIHPYGAQPTFGLATSGNEDKFEAADRLRRMFGRPALPIICGEVGVATGGAELANFLALPPADRDKRQFRTQFIAAMRGALGYYHYSHGSTLSGDLRTDAAGSCAALSRMHSLRGKTVPKGQSWLYNAGHVTATFSDGAVLLV